MRPLSLKSRIGFCIAAVIASALVVLSIVASIEFKEAMLRSVDHRLRMTAEAIRETILTDGVETEESRREIEAILKGPRGTFWLGYALWKEDDGTIWLEQTEPLNVRDYLRLQAQPLPKLGEPRILVVKEGKMVGQMLWTRFWVPTESGEEGRIIHLLLAASSEYSYHETREYVGVLAITGAILLVISIGVIYATFRWGFRPIDELTERMNRISEKNLEQVSFEFGPMPPELLPFVHSWKEMLQKLAEAMSQQRRFTADAAHELRTPLALVKSTLQLAQSQPRELSFYRQSIQHALEDLERMNRLVEQMLELSRLDRAEPDGTREPLELGAWLEDLSEQYSSYAQERGFRLVCRRCSAWIHAHPQQIRQLFGNLIDNALQYGPPGTDITIRMKTDDSFVHVQVHDEGGRIPPEECPFLFERFYRINKARDRHSGGTGLGLAIAQEIAVLHGGRITVRSNPQEGTIFTVVLPLEEKPSAS